MNDKIYLMKHYSMQKASSNLGLRTNFEFKESSNYSKVFSGRHLKKSLGEKGWGRIGLEKAKRESRKERASHEAPIKPPRGRMKGVGGGGVLYKTGREKES